MSGGQDPATVAFEQLRGEVALLRRGVEAIAAQAETKPVNYAPTLGKISKAITELSERLDALGERPALSLDAQGIALLLSRLNAQTLSTPLAEFARAQTNLGGVEARLTSAIGVIQDRHRQRQLLAVAGAGGFGLGLALWILCSGPIARALPTGWQVAEAMAAATLDEPRWEAGARLMRQADPQAWRTIVRGYDLVSSNASALDACERRAARQKKRVDCRLPIAPPTDAAKKPQG